MPVTEIASLAEVKAHLNVTASTWDAELTDSLAAATAMVEGKIGAVIERAVTEVATPFHGFLYLNNPVVTLTSFAAVYGATASGLVAATVTAQSPELARGKVWLGLSAPYCDLLVTYQAGRTSVPEDVAWATKEIVAWLWDTQRGPAQSSPAQADLADFAGPMPTVPHRVEQALLPYLRPVLA